MIDIHNKQALEHVFAEDFASPYFPVLAEIYLNEGDYMRAKQVCMIGLKNDSSNDCGKFMLAKISIAEEKPAIAERWLKQVINDNPANFAALRMLIRIEFILKRSPKTLLHYINIIIKTLPNDIEGLGWLNEVGIISSSISVKKRPINKKSDKPNVSKTNKHAIYSPAKQYNINESMATFTMVQVLKKQKSYQQALLVLNMLESKNTDLERIKKERIIINSLMNSV